MTDVPLAFPENNIRNPCYYLSKADYYEMRNYLAHQTASWVYASVCMYVCACVFACAFAFISKHMCMCFVVMFACVYVLVYVSACMCVRVRVFIYRQHHEAIDDNIYRNMLVTWGNVRAVQIEIQCPNIQLIEFANCQMLAKCFLLLFWSFQDPAPLCSLFSILNPIFPFH